MNSCGICEDTIMIEDPKESTVLQIGDRRYILCKGCAEKIESAIQAMQDFIWRSSEGEIFGAWAMRLDTYDSEGEVISSRIIEQPEAAQTGKGGMMKKPEDFTGDNLKQRPNREIENICIHASAIIPDREMVFCEEVGHIMSYKTCHNITEPCGCMCSHLDYAISRGKYDLEPPDIISGEKYDQILAAQTGKEE